MRSKETSRPKLITQNIHTIYNVVINISAVEASRRLCQFLTQCDTLHDIQDDVNYRHLQLFVAKRVIMYALAWFVPN